MLLSGIQSDSNGFPLKNSAGMTKLVLVKIGIVRDRFRGNDENLSVKR